MDSDAYITRAVEILKSERDAIDRLTQTIGQDFVNAVSLVRDCKGHVVLTGVGKSYIIAQKISASLASTGTPSIPLHPVDALHGDLGRVRPGDIVISLSNSGAGDEIVEFARTLQRIDVRTIVLTCNPESPLAKLSDITLDVGELEEACPLGVAPSTTTTAMLALGDALTLTVSEAKGFTLEGFASNHPNGSLGRRLLPITTLARSLEQTARVTQDSTVLDALNVITEKQTGSAFVIDTHERLIGVFTDGDLRRLLQENHSNLDLVITKYMTRNPKMIEETATVATGIHELRHHRINALPVVTFEGRLVGYLDIQDT